MASVSLATEYEPMANMPSEKSRWNVISALGVDPTSEPWCHLPEMRQPKEKPVGDTARAAWMLLESHRNEGCLSAIYQDHDCDHTRCHRCPADKLVPHTYLHPLDQGAREKKVKVTQTAWRELKEEGGGHFTPIVSSDLPILNVQALSCVGVWSSTMKELDTSGWALPQVLGKKFVRVQLKPGVRVDRDLRRKDVDAIDDFGLVHMSVLQHRTFPLTTLSAAPCYPYLVSAPSPFNPSATQLLAPQNSSCNMISATELASESELRTALTTVLLALKDAETSLNNAEIELTRRPFISPAAALGPVSPTNRMMVEQNSVAQSEEKKEEDLTHEETVAFLQQLPWN